MTRAARPVVVIGDLEGAIQRQREGCSCKWVEERSKSQADELLAVA
jgi:hypothetical protein